MLHHNDKEQQLNAQIWKFLHQRCKWWPTWACPNLYGIISPAYKFGVDIEFLKAFDDTLPSLWKTLALHLVVWRYWWGSHCFLATMWMFRKKKSGRRPSLTYRWCWLDKHRKRDQGSRTKATLLRRLRTCHNRPYRHSTTYLLYATTHRILSCLNPTYEELCGSFN